MKYTIDVRRYGTDNEDDGQTVEGIEAAYRFVRRQLGHGVFTAWVNGVRIRGVDVCSMSVSDFNRAVNPFMAKVAEDFEEAWNETFTPRVPTNPETYRALDDTHRLLTLDGNGLVRSVA